MARPERFELPTTWFEVSCPDPYAHYHITETANTNCTTNQLRDVGDLFLLSWRAVLQRVALDFSPLVNERGCRVPTHPQGGPRGQSAYVDNRFT